MSNINNLTFHKRPIPVQPEYRPVYKIAQIVLILKKGCRKYKASLLLLHLHTWALKSKENEAILIKYLLNPNKNELNTLTFEPALNRALHFAQSEELITILLPQGHYVLTEKGHKFSELLLKDFSVLINEKAFFTMVKYSLTETLVKKITQKWKKDNA
jgi:hypothetical protein